MPLFLIDGYNVLFYLSRTVEDLKGHREALIHLLHLTAKRHRLSMLIVFDARLQLEEARRTHFRELEIHYTAANETADDHILRYLSCARKRQQIIVVTSDRDLARRSCQQGAKTESVELFIKRLGKPLKRERQSVSASQTTPSKPSQPISETILLPPSKEVCVEECFDYYYQKFSRILRKDE